ncbi:hypothetical protein ACJMK2_039688, partial [Sinanodonta woodiana]
LRLATLRQDRISLKPKMHIITMLAVVLVAFVKISYGNHIETAMARSRGFGGGGGVGGGGVGGGGVRGGGAGGFQGFGGGMPGRATIPGMQMPGDPSFARMFGGGGALGGRRQRGGLQGDLFGGAGGFPGGFADGGFVGGRDGLPMFGGSGQSDPRGAADGRFDGSLGNDLSSVFGQGLVPPAIGLGGTFGATDGGFMDPMSGQPVQLVSTGVAEQFRQARLGNGGGQSQGLGLGGIFGAVQDAQFIDPTSGAPVQLAPTGVINTLRDARAGGFAGFGGQGGGVPTFPGAGLGGNMFQQQGFGGFPQGGAGGAGSFAPGIAGGDQFQPITIRIPNDRSRGPTVTRAGFTEQMSPGTTLADLGLGGQFGASAGSFGQIGAGQQGFESFGQQGLGARAGGQGGSQIFSSQSLPNSIGFPQGGPGLGSQAAGGFDAAFAGLGAQNPFGGGQPQAGGGFQGQFGAGSAASFGPPAGQQPGQQFGGLTFTQLGGQQTSQGGASSNNFPMEFSQFQDLPGGAGGQFQSSFDAQFQGSGASSSGFGSFSDQAGTSLPGVSLTASNQGLGQFSQSSSQGTDLTGFSGLSQPGSNPFSQGPTSGGQFGGASVGGSTGSFSGQGGSSRGNLADQTFGGPPVSGSGNSAAGPVVRSPIPSGQPNLVVLQTSDERRENVSSIIGTLSGTSEIGGSKTRGSVRYIQDREQELPMKSRELVLLKTSSKV